MSKCYLRTHYRECSIISTLKNTEAHCPDKLYDWNFKTTDFHHFYPVRQTCYFTMEQKNFLKIQSCNYKTLKKWYILNRWSSSSSSSSASFFFLPEANRKKLESQDSQLILIHNSETLISSRPDYMLSIRCHGDLTRLWYLWYPAKTLTTTPEIWLRCSLCFLLLHLMNSSWNIISNKPFHRAPVSHCFSFYSATLSHQVQPDRQVASSKYHLTLCCKM